MAGDLLLEIGVEELPAPYTPPAALQLAAILEKELAGARLEFDSVKVHATPRRMAAVVSSICDRQPDVAREVVGPPARVAFAEDGTPTKAAIGFAKSQGVDVFSLSVKETEKGEYAVAGIVDGGKPAVDVLPGLLAAVIRSIEFPKTMRWGPEERFARPIRWLVAMLGGETLRLRYAGIEASPYTYGHRFWSPGPHELHGASDYLEVLAKNYVIADVEKRRDLIRRSAMEVAAEVGGRAVIDDDLLSTVTFIVECPTAFAGRFDRRFLDLPRDVVVAAMKGHQRYFAVESDDGSLLPYFVCIANCPNDYIDLIREGNERVLVSRLDDAEFYWKEDTNAPFETRVEDLRSVVWLEGLGSLYEKTERITKLAGSIGERLHSPELPHAVRAARLAKADLVTEMVKDGKEFTELQGLMGREYALKSGEPPAVAEAIYEHYFPRFAGDDLPASGAGAILSIADKMDSIAGCFSAGLIPTGSQDPYALRRQATGVIRIILERGLALSTGDLVESAVAGYGLDEIEARDCAENVRSFLKQRARTVFIDRGHAYDVVDAVLEALFDDLVGAVGRLGALSHFRTTDDFAGLVIGAKRVTNILKGIPVEELPRPVPHECLTEREESALLAACRTTSDAVEAALDVGDFDGAVRELLLLRGPIDALFDNVMVMVEDDRLRSARLSLLWEVRKLFLRIADFSRVVLEGDKG